MIPRSGLLLILLMLLPAGVFCRSECDKRLDDLSLHARVVEVTSSTAEKNSIRIRMKMEVTLTNRGSEPIIFLRPGEEGKDGLFEWFWGVAVSGANQYGAYPLFSSGGLPSSCGGCDDELGKLLDAPRPPEKYMQTLPPEGTWVRIEYVWFGMPLTTGSGNYGWDEVKANKQKLTGSISFAMFPASLEGYKRDFGKRLKQRWKKYGVLYYCDTHSLIYSEQFEIDLSEISLPAAR